MGNTCLGEPRKKVELMQVIDSQEKRYRSERAKPKVQAVQGESNGNVLKISKSLLSCSICMINYNLTTRQPLIACPNNHTICKTCLSASSNYSNRCPQCRSDLKDPIRNRDIYQLIEDNQKILDQNKLQQVNQQSEFKILTIDKNNKSISNFWIEGNRIMKIGDNRIWEGFVSKETLSRDKNSSFSVRVIFSKFNNIEIGVVGKGYRVEKGVTCREAVMYHLADGMVLEGVKGRRSQWRGKGEKIQPGTSISIEVVVDRVQQKVQWVSQQKTLAEARLSDYLIENDCIAYVMMSICQDVVELNG